MELKDRSFMMLNKIGIIGDVHAEDERLEAALAWINQQDGVDAILCVGDLVDGPGDAVRCIDLLTDAGVFCVRGNHDRWLLRDEMRGMPDATDKRTLAVESVEYLSSLPSSQTFETPAGNLLLCHGMGDNDMRRLTPDDEGYALVSNDEFQILLRSPAYRLVIAGHTHQPMVRMFTGLTVINPGTLYRENGPRFAVADFVEHSVSYFLIGDDLSITAGDVRRFGNG